MKHVTRNLALTSAAVAVCCLVVSGGAGADWVSPTDEFPVRNGQYAVTSGTTFEPVDGEPVPYDVEIVSMSLIRRPDSPTVSPPGIGQGASVDSFFDIWSEMDGSTGPWTDTTSFIWNTYLTNTSLQDTDNPQQFDIDLLPIGGGADELSMVGPDDVAIALRLSPTERSYGQHSITSLADGTFEIDSFFDVFFELSVDGGPFHPATDSVHLEFSIVPEPATLSLLSIGAISVLCLGGWAQFRRRRKSQTAA